MKRILAMGALLLLLVTAGCGTVSDAKVDIGQSKLYAEEEREDAAKAVRKHFKSMYNGCTLLTVVYDGDDKAKENLAYCKELEPTKAFVDCVVFHSTFETGKQCDTSLEPEETYTDWRWYLAREKNGEWQLVMEGQG